MIVCKKPCTIYDVDLAGLSALTVLGLLTYFVVVLPVRTHWDTYRELSARQHSSETAIRQTDGQLRKAESDIARLQAAIVKLSRQAPQAGSLPQFLSRATVLAEGAQLEVFQVVPHATRAVDECLVAEIEMSGRGHSLDFVRFLDTLARENPYQSLQQFSITRREESDDGVCDLSWTIRLRMLPVKSPAYTEGQS
jgi:Tfp pilus assembly protein PilO